MSGWNHISKIPGDVPTFVVGLFLLLQLMFAVHLDMTHAHAKTCSMYVLCMYTRMYTCTSENIHTLHCIALYCIASHYTTLHYSTLHYMTWHDMTLHTYMMCMYIYIYNCIYYIIYIYIHIPYPNSRVPSSQLFFGASDRAPAMVLPGRSLVAVRCSTTLDPPWILP